MAAILPVVISLLEIIVSEQVYEMFNSLSSNNTIILFLISIIIISIISVYSSRNKWKYFLSIFFTSLVGGYGLSLLILIVFDKIIFPEKTDPVLIQTFLLGLISFGAIPAISISLGLLTPRKSSLGESLSE